jgi:hypothetical protein
VILYIFSNGKNSKQENIRIPCPCLSTLESEKNIGVDLLIFGKKIRFFFKKDRNALIDAKMNENCDVKIVKRGLRLFKRYVYSRF